MQQLAVITKMSEEQKLFWKIYEEFCSTKYIPENTENIIDEYLTKTNRNIIDIGSGQSSHILDFHNKKKHNLFACAQANRLCFFLL